MGSQLSRAEMLSRNSGTIANRPAACFKGRENRLSIRASSEGLSSKRPEKLNKLAQTDVGYVWQVRACSHHEGRVCYETS